MIRMCSVTITIFIFIISNLLILGTTCYAQGILENMRQSYESRRMIENIITDER